MLERLAAAIEEADFPADGQGLLEAYRLLDRFAAKLSQAVGEFDASGEWGLDGAASAVAWLRHRAGLVPKAAASAVGTARRLRELPVTAAAWRDGSLSGGQVQAVVANVDDRTAPQFAAQEADLVPMLADLSTSQTAKAMQFWRARAEALVDDAEPGLPERAVYLSRGLAGRWVLNGDLDPEGGTLLATALRLATTEDGAEDPVRTPARRRADALADMARFFLDHQQHVPAGRHRPHLNVVVQYDDVVAGRGGELVDGGLLDGASIRRLLCDASVHRVVTDGRSTILDYGTATRTVPRNLWSALALRDRHCRHDGCDRPSWWCDAHHVVPVLEGGPTSLDNLVLKCSRHHHLGHQRGWHEKLLPDGTLVVTDPAGRTRTTKPPGLVPTLLWRDAAA
ncbi:MAG: HNH endonuclease [Actinomycetota bacterium]|nr:HNH endonuclease [Actinomycetota bacterium]